MKVPIQQVWGVVLPLLGCTAFAMYWLVFGWQPMDRFELPLAMLLHSAAGRSDLVDWTIIFFNRWWGEAVCVALIYLILFCWSQFAPQHGGKIGARSLGSLP